LAQTKKGGDDLAYENNHYIELYKNINMNPPVDYSGLFTKEK
jgi:hypothetical protein